MRSFRARLRFFAECDRGVPVRRHVRGLPASGFHALHPEQIRSAWTQEFVLIVYIWIVFWCARLPRCGSGTTSHSTWHSSSLPPGARRRLAIVLTAIDRHRIPRRASGDDRLHHLHENREEPGLRHPVRPSLFDLRRVRGGGGRRRGHPDQAAYEPIMARRAWHRQEIDA